MKNRASDRASFIIVYWWLLVLAICGIALFFYAPKEERVSESENRMLAGFPELTGEAVLSGEFFLGIESYLSDGVWGRDGIVGISESLLGFFSANTLQEENLLNDIAMSDELQGKDDTDTNTDDIGGTAGIPSGSDAQTPGSQPDNDGSDTPGADSGAQEAAGGYGVWYVYENGELVPFHRPITADEEDIRTVAKALNAYRAQLPADGSVFYTNVPMSYEASMARKGYAGWYENLADGLAKYTDEGVYSINAPALLEEPLLRGDGIYFTSDHHWTPRGALMLVNECMRLQGLPGLDYDEYKYQIGRFENPTAHTSDDLPLMELLQEAAGSVMNGGQAGEECQPVIYERDNYKAYLNGDTRLWDRYITGFSTGRRALVIGDSFSNPFTVYLFPYYDEVHKTDVRHFRAENNGGTVAELIELYEIDDVYIILSTANGVAADASNVWLMRALGAE